MMSSTSPFLSNVTGLITGSHKQVEVECQLQIADNCAKKRTAEYRHVLQIMENNEGKYVCLQCSRKYKSTGRSNPNCRYQSFDDQFMKVIDTEEKAYLLGWIASDGTIAKTGGTMAIAIHKKDGKTLEVLRDILCKQLPIKEKPVDLVTFSANSKELCKDICTHLDIQPGKKSGIVGFPCLSRELSWAFIRGLFDGDGSIRKFTETRHGRECSIASSSNRMKSAIAAFVEIKSHINEWQICFTGSNCIDFLSKIYDAAQPSLRLQRKYELYLQYLLFVPGLNGEYGSLPHCKYVKTSNHAFAPSKNNASDEGYDLWLIDTDKKLSDKTTRFETGIKVQPEAGYHVELLPRSSLSNYGYILTNSVGIIDESYIGTLKVTLTKVDDSLPGLQLPFKAVQLVLRKSMHFGMQEEEELELTQRGDGGFGSTDYESHESHSTVDTDMSVAQLDEFNNSAA